jgi:hypothetical protein
MWVWMGGYSCMGTISLFDDPAGMVQLPKNVTPLGFVGFEAFKTHKQAVSHFQSIVPSQKWKSKKKKMSYVGLDACLQLASCKGKISLLDDPAGIVKLPKNVTPPSFVGFRAFRTHT